MKEKIFTILIALAISLLCFSGFTVDSQAKEEETSTYTTLSATVTAKFYHENGDYYTTAVTDENGNVWIINDYVCNLNAHIYLIVNTQGTENASDDELISVHSIVRVKGD